MSGVETLAVVGILANVAAITRFCSTIVEQSIAFRKFKEVPRALRSLQVILPLIELTLEKTKDSGGAGKLEAQTCEKLMPAVQDCEKRLEELKAKLQHMIPADDASRLKILWKQTWSLSREKEVNDLANEIMRSHLLIHQAGAVVPTSNEVTAVTTRVDVRLDELVEDMIKQLLVRDDCPVQLLPEGAR
jgi:N-terminal domain on NACHT_NTPase and P-loop NTPases